MSGEPGVAVCSHDLAYGAACIYCRQILTPQEVFDYTNDIPNHSWYEVYWPGPRELHACCDPWGISLRGVDAPCPEGDCEQQD